MSVHVDMLPERCYVTKRAEAMAFPVLWLISMTSFRKKLKQEPMFEERDTRKAGRNFKTYIP